MQYQQATKNRNPYFTDEELRIARDTDLTQLAERLGYTVKRVGHYHTTKEMDSLRIRDRRTWKRYSTGECGDTISFVQTFCGKSFPEAVRYLLDYQGRSAAAPEPPRETPIPRERPPPFHLPIAWHDQRRVFAYLRSRGIAAQVIEGFIRSSVRGSAAPQLRLRGQGSRRQACVRSQAWHLYNKWIQLQGRCLRQR